MKTSGSLKLTIIRRSAGNAHRYFCMVNGKYRTILTHEKDAYSILASLFGYLNQFVACGHYAAARLLSSWILATVLMGSVFCFKPAYALPTDYQTAAGSVQFHQPDANTLDVTSSSAKSIVNYQTFNIGRGETVNFFLPNAASSILNRVVGGSPSEILGRMNSNGNVFLVNPSGIIFGSSAQVTVGSLFASTLGISNQDFLAGRYIFKQEPGASPAGIVNQGQIQAREGGSVVLAAGGLQNSGMISAPLGKVQLAVGQEITLSVDNDIWLDVTVDEALKSKVEGFQDAIQNTGSIKAQGGSIKAEAELLSNFYERAINNPGIIQADGIENHNGTIELVAHAGSNDAVIRNTGLVDANGDKVFEGETITLNGDYIEQAGTLQADGLEGGQGGEIYLSSTQGTELASGSVTSAKGAGDHGDGGKIRVWSDKDTHFDKGAVLDVSGGKVSGNGGFAEVSAKNTVHFEGQAKGTAHNGKGGSILIDPTNVRLVAVDPNPSAANIPFTDPDNGAGESTFQADSFSGFASVNIEATNDISVESNFDLTGVTAGSSATLKAGNNVSIQAPMTTGGGDINLIADGDFSGGGGAASDGNGSVTITGTGSLDSAGGEITLRGSTVDIDGTVNAGAGSVTLNPSTNTQPIEVGGGASVLDAEPVGAFGVSTPELGQITASSVSIGTTANTGNMTVMGNIDTSGRFDLDLATGGDYDANGKSYTLGGKDLTVTATGNLGTDAVSGGAGAAVTFSSQGAITVNGVLSVDSLTLQTTANNSNIDLGANVTGTTNVTLSAHGSGTVSQSAGTISGGAATIASTSGDLGSLLTPLQTDVTSLTLNTGGSAYDIENSGLTLGASTVGGTLQVAAGSTIVTNGVLSADNLALSTTANNGSIVLGASATGTTSVNLTAQGSGVIAQAAGTISGGAATFSSALGNLGSVVTPLQTNVTSLTLNTGGSAYDIENSSLTLGASTVGGTLQVAAGNTITTSGVLSANSLDLSTTANNGGITFGANASGTTGITLSTHGTGNIIITAPFLLSSTNAPITLTANDVDLQGTLNAGAGTVTLKPNGNKGIAVADNADGDGDDATFDVNTTELNNISAGSLAIGSTLQTGNLTVLASKNFSALYNLTLNNGGNIDATGFTLTMGAKTLTETALGTLATGTITGGAGTINLTSSGAMTVNSDVTGTGNVSLTGLGIALGGNVGTGTSTNLTASGAGVISQASGTVSGTTINLASNSGNIGGIGTAINTAAGTLTVNSTSGNAYIAELDGVTLGASTVGGTYQLTAGNAIVTNGALSANSLDLSTTANNGSITLGANAAGTTSVTLTAHGSGTISQSAGTISGGAAAISSTSGNLGSLVTPLQTNVTSLTLNTAGSAYDIENSALTLGASTVGGTLQVAAGNTITTSGALSANSLDLSTTANNGGITFGANATGTTGITLATNGTGNIVVTAPFLLSSTNAPITLTANDINLAGTLNAGAGTVTLAPNGNKAIAIADNADGDGDDATFDINTTELNNISASNLIIGSTLQTGNLTVLGSKNVSALYNLTLNNGGNISATGFTLTTGAKTLTETALGTLATGTVTGGAGTINLTSSGAMTVNGDVTGTGIVGLTGLGIALGGNVGTGTTTNLTATGAGVISRASGTVSGTTVNLLSNTGNIGAFGSTINTAAGTLTVNSTTGNAYIAETDAITLGASTVGSLLQLSAGGNIATSGALSANSLDLSTTAGNGSITFGANALGTAGVTLSTNGTGNIIITAPFVVSSTNTAITLTANDINLAGTLNAGAGTVTLKPNGNKAIAIADNADGDGDDATFDVNTTELSNISAGSLAIGSTLQTGNLTVLGSKNFSALYNVALNNGGNIDATGFTLTMGAKTLTETALGTLATGTITGGAGAITLASSGAMTVNGPVTGTGTVDLTGLGMTLGGNVGGGTLTNLTATGAGALSQTSGTVSGTTVNLLSNTGNIGALGTPINTAAGTLTANSTSGNAYIAETDAVTLGASTLGGLLQLSAGGSIATSGALSASNLDLSTTANNGGITFGANASGTTGVTLATQGTGRVTVSNPFSVSTTNSAISITANDLDLQGSLNAGSNTVTLKPNGNKSIAIADNADGDGDDATFDVNTTELSNISASNLIIGSTLQTGNLTVLGSKNVSALYNLTLNNGGNIDATGTTLTMGAKTLTETALGTLTTGTVTGGAGTITLASSGAMTVNGDVTGTGTVSLTGLGIALGGNVGTGTTTNLTATGAGVISRASGTVSGTTVNLLSNTGNIGALGSTINTAAGTLTVNSTTGNAYIAELDGVTLGASTVGGSYQLTAGNSITTNGAIATNSLDLSTTANNGSITFSANATGSTGVTLATNGTGRIVINNTFGVSAANAAINMTAHDIDIQGTLNAGAAGTVTLTPNGNKSIAVADNADGDGDDATFDINTTELGKITTGTLTLGDTQIGGLTVLGDIDLTGRYNLALANGGNITATNRLFTLAGHTLTATATNDVAITTTLNNTGINLTSVTGRDITLTTTGTGSPINATGNISSSRNLTISTQSENITVGGTIGNTGGAGNAVYLYAGTTTPAVFNLTGLMTISDNATKDVTLATGTGTLFSNAFFNAAHIFGNIDYRTLGANTPITIGANLTGQAVSIISTGLNNQINQTAGTITGTPLTLISDELNLSGNLTASGGGVLTLQPANAGTTIGLGGGTGLFNLSNLEFSRMSAGTIVIGSTATTGAVDIGSVDLGPSAADFTLQTTGAITDTNTLDDSTANLILANNKNLTITGGAGTGSGQIGAPGGGDLDVTMGGSGLLEVKTNNADVYINATTGLLLGLVDAGTGRINLETSAGSILDGNGNSLNLIAGADSFLKSGSDTTATIGSDTDALEVAITNATLSVQASGDNNNISVNINGTVTPGDTLTPVGFTLNQIHFNSNLVPVFNPTNPGTPYLLVNNPTIPFVEGITTGEDIETIEVRLDQQIVTEPSVMDWFMEQAEEDYKKKLKRIQQEEKAKLEREKPQGPEYFINQPGMVPKEDNILPIKDQAVPVRTNYHSLPSKKALFKEILQAAWNFRDPLDRVYRKSIDIESPMEMRPRRKARGTDIPNHITLLDEVPFLHPELRHMNIDGAHPLAMIQTYRATMKAKHFRDLYLAGGDCPNRAPEWRTQINSLMIIPGGDPVVIA